MDPKEPEPKEPEEQLWEMARLDEAEEGGDLSDDTLRAWREGRLTESETEDVEARLSRSPAARARLRELAGLESGAPRPEVRERVLAGFGAGSRLPVRRPLRWRTALAAAALAASLLFAVVLLRTPSGLPPGLAYDVSARGLAAERSTAPNPVAPVQAYPDTAVRLEVSPRGAAEEDVELGLYRVREGRLERIEPGPSLTVETDRGAARFRALAGDLVGPQPGTRNVYVVVSRAGDLPEGGPLRPGEDPRLRLAGEDGQRLVYTQSIQIRKGPPS